MTRDTLKEIGLDVDEVIAAAERAGPAAAAQLAYEVDVALSALEDGYGELVESPELPRAVSAAASRQAREVQRAASALKAGRITQAQFNRRVHEAIATNFRSAYDATMRRPLSPGDELWLSRAVEAEFEFARNFGQDIVEGNIRMPIHKRSEMYGQTVHGIAWNAEVEKHGSDTRIFWRLGQAEHCDDCILLACLLSKDCKILTIRGMVPLERVRVGDLVMTHRGRWRRVTAKPVHRSTTAHRYAVLVAEGGRLIGLTDDHRLWTEAGWRTAREVAHGENTVTTRSAQLCGMRCANMQSCSAVQAMCRISAGTQINSSNRGTLRKSKTRGFFLQQEKESLVCSMLEWRALDNCLATPMGMGNGQWEGTNRLCCASQGWKFVKRRASKSRNNEGWKTYELSYERDQLAELQGSEDNANMSGLWQEVCAIWTRTVLFEKMFRARKIRQIENRIDLLSVRKDISAEQRGRCKQIKKGRPTRFLLSRLLSKMEMEGRGEKSDPCLRLLRQDLRASRLSDISVEVGQVILLPSVLRKGALLYDLTVEEDHSFVVDGMIVHNSSSPFTKNSLPTTPKAGATQCRCVATPSARVLTRRGPIPIVDVVAGDRVLTHKGRWRRVEKTHRFENDRSLMDLKAPTGRVVRFTADHWFMTKRGWVPLREIDRTRLPMYAANHELLKMWSQDSQRRGQWTVLPMPADMPDVWGEEGSPGKRMPFMWYESQGKITMGAFKVTQTASWWHSRSWFGKAASVFRSCTQRFYESKVGRTFLRDVSIWWSQALGLSVPLVVGASPWADWRRDGFASQKWRLHRRSVGESGVVEDWRTCANAFRKRKQSTMERRAFGLELPGVRQEVQEVLEKGEAPQVLFAGMPHKSTTILYDLTVEEDHSFVVEGLVSHNSNCKCRLEFRSGRKNRDAEQADARRDERLIDMLRPPGAPPGLRPPTIGEAAYIADLRAQINFNRRLIAMATDEKAIRAAAAARKAANAELIEFLEQQGIYEVPVWSVDEVVTGADIGGVAERDLFIHGIDGASLDVLSESQLRRLITQYEEDMGEAFPKAYSRPSIKDEARRTTRRGGLATPTPVAEEYQIVGEGLKDTKWILGRLMLAARGADVQVGPYRDEFVDGAYAWVKGSEAAEVVERLSSAAKEAGVRFVATPVELQRRRDHASTTMSERKVQDRERSVYVRQQEESRAGIRGVPGEEKRASDGVASGVEGNPGSCMEGNCGCSSCRGR